MQQQKTYGSKSSYFISGKRENNFQGGGFGGKRNFRSGSNGGGRRRSGFSESIDISKFVKRAKPIEQIDHKIEKAFSDFGFCSELNNNLKFKKYETPTPIQDKAMGFIMEGRDLIGLANTGTGKTAAFLLPLIQKTYLDKSQKVLIIAPTRELALQIEQEFRQFSWNMKLFSAACVGGMPAFKQIQNLKRNPSFVIGTPGRLKDLSERGFIKFETFNNIVLDEVDRMLDMGFVDEIKDILAKIPDTRQALFFSATLPPKIKELTSRFLKNPEIVEIESGETTDNVNQDVVRVLNKDMKFNQLKELLSGPDFRRVLIFAETKNEVDKLANHLKSEGFKSDCIHGDKKQRERARSLTLFKDGSINVLVATDVAARGLDIKDISHVINYTVPQTYTDYIHRIGRTGRGGKSGCALTFV
jgi:superfamily II DNA/RNA helicase